MSIAHRPYWEVKSLAEMSWPEWEALCDGCGQCCRHRLEDADTGAIHPTRVACQLLDTQTCRCKDYPNRWATVPDCIQLTPKKVAGFRWLPDTCAYRRIHEGRGLAEWHPLVSGDPDSIHKAGISVQGQLLSEQELPPDSRLEDYTEEEA